MRLNLQSRFGGHLRGLRQSRSLTQEVLAERCDLSVDAIRRIERGGFSPSLETLAKLSRGLEVSLHTLFQKFGSHRGNGAAEVCDYLANRNRNQVKMAWRVLRALFEPENIL